MSKKQLALDYLTHPTIQLLDEYGAGSHIPGSGSAAALSALITIEMMRTVCKLTIKKVGYKHVHSAFEKILKKF